VKKPGPSRVVLYSGEDDLAARLDEELKRALKEGHAGMEGWQVKKDGSRFWANIITMALKDDLGRSPRVCPRGSRF
jgi:hypothetical protein